MYDILFEVESGKKSAKEAEAALGKLDNKAESLGGSFGKLGGILAGVFATQKIVQFTQEAFELGLKAEGVRKAFNNLNNPNLLANLRRATRGTVDDLTLMQASVRADKFKIPLDNLAKLFKFASIRARETGQSVNFLVDSIVDGIGRKSPLILDNLGIRAQDLQDEFKKTGDFAKAAANVISKEIGASGKVIETQAEKVERLRTSWQNFKVDLGVGILDALGKTETAFESFGNTIVKFLPFLNTLSSDVQRNTEDLQQQMQDAAEAAKNFVNNLTPKQFVDLPFTIADMEAAIGNLQAKMKETNTTTAEGEAEIRSYAEQIKVLEERIKALTETQGEFKVAQQETNFATVKGIEEFKTAAIGVVEIQGQIQGAAVKTATALEQIPQALRDSLPAMSEVFGNLAKLAKDGSKAQQALAIANVIASNAEALAAGVASAAKLPFPANLPAIFSVIATITGVFASIRAMSQQAQSAGEAVNVSAFAEGEVDIHRPGEKRGKDSIPAMIMPGESVMTTEETARYKPILEAIRGGTLEDLIHQNYIEPSLAVNALEHAKNDSTELDYSERFYRQWMETHEGNSINKKAARHLASIDRKLSGGIPEKYR